MPGVRRRGGRPRQRLRCGVRRRAGARQHGAPAPGGDAWVLRGPRLARPDRAVRHARPAPVPEPDRRGDVGDGARGRPDPDRGGATVVGARRARWCSGCRWQELAFISWAGLRGAVPIVLATIPLAAEVDRGDLLFDIVFVLVVIDTVLTGPTLPWVARCSSRAAVGAPRHRARGGAARAGGRRHAAGRDQSEVRLHGVEVGELRLPPGASVTLIVRDGADPGARVPHRAAARRRPARRHPAQAARRDRAEAAPGERRRPARAVDRPTSPASASRSCAQSTGGLQI